jgi:hypothetical protein
MMTNKALGLGLFSLAQLVIAWLVWRWLAPNPEWNVVQQFWGHIGPGTFLVAMGVAVFFLHRTPQLLTRIEAWLAIVAGAAYVLADTFIMHPLWGVFDGAGRAEWEHVSIMSLIAMLGVSALVLLPRQGAQAVPSIQIVVAVAVVAFVFLAHEQPTMAGTMGHQATSLLLVVAALFRVMGKLVEYGVALVLTGFVFFSSQMGLTNYVAAADFSPGAWITIWVAAGFVSATVYMAFSPREAGGDG